MAKQLIKNPEDIRLTEQHEIEAIMGNPPGRLLLSGNYIFLFGILLLLGLGYFLPYPDVVEAKVKLVSDSPPIRLVPRQSGRIIELFKVDEAEVTEGEKLAIIDNSANWEHILQLDSFFILKLKSLKISKLRSSDLPKNLNLGELQTPYAVFVNNLETANFNYSNDRTQAQLATLEEQIKNYQQSNISLEKRVTEGEVELDLIEKNVDRGEKLHATQNLSMVELEKIKIQKSQKKQQIESIANQKATNEAVIHQLEKQKIDLRQRTRLAQNEYDLKTVSAFENLKGAIEEWKKKYLILAPTSGRLSIPNLLTINHFVQMGEEIMTIIPKYQSVSGRAQLGQDNIGEIALQDSVKIKLAGFPYYDYGTIRGTVSHISSLPENDFYTIKIEIPARHILMENDSLKIKTSYQKYIPVRQEMEGIARIITEENTYLGRIYNRLRSTFD